MRAKGYEDVEQYVAPWTGEKEFAEIVEAIEARGGQRAPPHVVEVPPTAEVVASNGLAKEAVGVESLADATTPQKQGDLAHTPRSPPEALLGLDVPATLSTITVQ